MITQTHRCAPLLLAAGSSSQLGHFSLFRSVPSTDALDPTAVSSLFSDRAGSKSDCAPALLKPCLGSPHPQRNGHAPTMVIMAQGARLSLRPIAPCIACPCPALLASRSSSIKPGHFSPGPLHVPVLCLDRIFPRWLLGLTLTPFRSSPASPVLTTPPPHPVPVLCHALS